jgi:hypothetical protein
MAIRIVFIVGRVAPTGCPHCLLALGRRDFSANERVKEAMELIG